MYVCLKRKIPFLSQIDGLPISLKIHVSVYHLSRWSVHSCLCISIILNMFGFPSHSFLFFFSEKSAFLVFSISLYLEIYLVFYDCNCSSLKLFYSLEVSLMCHMRANHRFILFWILLWLYLTYPFAISSSSLNRNSGFLINRTKECGSQKSTFFLAVPSFIYSKS